ncbi:MAG: DUF4124 domain-containing protein [Oleiphilus sp.]
MKWFYRLFTVGMLAAVVIGPFLLKKPDGKPIMEMPTAGDFIPDKLMPGNDDSSEQSSVSGQGNQTFYKWQDEQGQWHYGDQPPVESAKVSTLQVDTNTNIIQSLKVAPKEADTSEPDIPQQKKLPERLSNGELSFENASNAMNDAILVRDMMETRNSQLKAITGE